MKFDGISISDIAEKLSAEATRLAADQATGLVRGPLAIAALMLAACVEGQLCEVSLETMLSALRTSWRDVERAVTACERARERPRTNDDGTSN